MARFYFGEVASIACRTKRVNPKIKGEDTATMLLQHVDGAVSVVDCSYATPMLPDPFPETLVEIDGDRGALRLEQGYRLRISRRDGKLEQRELDPDAAALGRAAVARGAGERAAASRSTGSTACAAASSPRPRVPTT